VSPLVVIGTLLGALDGNIRWCLSTAARGHVPASWKKSKFGRLAAAGVLGDGVAQLPGVGPACGIQVMRSCPPGEPISELVAWLAGPVTTLGPRARS
jgi:hypothetical protein